MSENEQNRADKGRERIQSIFEAFLDLDRSVRADVGANLLSHEFRLILLLFVKKGLIVKDAALSSQLSTRAFYELLKRLEQENVLCSRPNALDRRAKSIFLCPEFSQRLVQEVIKRGLVAPLSESGRLSDADDPSRTR